MPCPTGSPASDQGFTLLEALVALVAISIGLLGLLGLQTVSLVNTQLSEARSTASIAADDIADRIRANPTGAIEGDYDDISNPYSEGDQVPSPDCLAVKCTAPQMATLDAWEWDQSIFSRMRGAGFVRCTVGRETKGDPCRTYTVVVAWNERNPGATEAGSGNETPLSVCDVTGDLSKAVRDYNQCFVTEVRP